ncbi:uncharacterized protein [Procambarus clarkii]|uniref:uncharacterized protein n=1 Tax=Procambarus clarkii TaxID=6728 RepID=UPI00374491CE
MAAAATNAVYSQVFKKKLADVFRVGAGGGLCFCGINMYFKNDKFYDDWVMPIFNRMEPETAYAVAQQAAKYKLVTKEKLQESRLLVSTQPSSKDKMDHEDLAQEEDESCKAFDCIGDEFRGSTDDLIGPQYEKDLTRTLEPVCQSRVYDSEFEPDETCSGFYGDDASENCQHQLGSNIREPCGDCHQALQCIGDESKVCSIKKTFVGDMSHYRSDLRACACNSPKNERNCVTPDSPSLSMRVNIASPLRSSKMSLATMVDGSNPAYDQGNADEAVDLIDKVNLESNCELEDCIASHVHDGCRTNIVSIVDGLGEVYKSDSRDKLTFSTTSDQHNGKDSPDLV